MTELNVAVEAWVRTAAMRMPGLSASEDRRIVEPAGTKNVYSDWMYGNEKSPTFATRASLGRNTTSHAPTLRHSMTCGGL